MRKEDRRQARSSKREGLGGEDHAAVLRAQGFDPEELKRQRYIYIHTYIVVCVSSVHLVFLSIA